MKRKTRNIRRWALILMSAALLIPVLAACSAKNTDDDPANRRTLRIGMMYGSRSDETYFRQQYTDLFEFSHKGIDIEVVPAIDWSQQQFESMDENGRFIQPDPFEKTKEIMTGANPVDVMIFDMNIYSSLVNENMLMQLDPYLKEDKVDLDAFIPTIIEDIREQGNGSIYALTPTFMPSALYYNKKLFAEAQVTPPQDGMSWDEVFNLARQMSKGSGKDAVYGFAFSQWGGTGENWWDVQNFAAPLQLKMYDANAEMMTINTPQWKNLWETIYKLHEDRVIPRQEDMGVFYEPQSDGVYRYNPFQGQLFLNGHVAMVIGNYGMINEIQQMNENADKLNIEPLDWDVVTVPYHASAPGVGAVSSYSYLTGINANARNVDDAWEYVKFLNSEEWAVFKSRSTYELSTRTAFVKPREGMDYHIEAFTKMRPAAAPGQSLAEQRLMREKPNLRYINELVNIVYSSIFRGERTVEEALEYLDTKGNDILQKIKTNPKDPIDGIFDEIYGEMSSTKMNLMRASGAIP